MENYIKSYIVLNSIYVFWRFYCDIKYNFFNFHMQRMQNELTQYSKDYKEQLIENNRLNDEITQLQKLLKKAE